jgi:hypothetical protein
MGVVVMMAVLGGRWAGALAAITAALSFDFFLTRPYLTLRMTEQDDIETTIILLVVGVAVGQFADLAHRNRQTSRATRSELDRVRRLANAVSQGENPDDVQALGARELTELLNLDGCAFESGASACALPRLERSGVIESRKSHPAVVRRYTRGGFELPLGGVELPVFHRGRQLGRFILMATPGVGVTLEQRVVALALADQVGAALGDDESH